MYSTYEFTYASKISFTNFPSDPKPLFSLPHGPFFIKFQAERELYTITTSLHRRNKYKDTIHILLLGERSTFFY